MFVAFGTGASPNAPSVRMLEHIHRNTTDKIVLVSNYTQTLSLLERMCRNKK